MINVSILKEPAYLEKDRLITSDIGEITKIEDGSYYGCYLLFYDSKGASFSVSTNWNFVRYTSLCWIDSNKERSDLLPREFKKDNGLEDILCNDPRVIWACIVSLWLTNASPRHKHITREKRGEFLTSSLPCYKEACVWMVKNEFVLMPSKVEKRHNRYLENYAALKFPPKVDWSIFPDYKDN